MRSATADEGRLTLQVDGRARTYVVRVPPSLSPTRRVPLVLVLHGGGGNGFNAEAMTGFTPLARSEGFIVAYPEGTARGRVQLLTWNAGHCCGYALESRVDDVGFLAALIDQLVRTYPIDGKRVYITGMSNGAMMAHRAGIELGDKIAAIAPVVGGIFGDERATGSGVSAIIINGLLDRSVPYDGGPPGGPFARSWDGTPVRPAVEQASFWASANGCTNPGNTETTDYVHVRYECPAPRAVEFYGIKNNGHAWPGGQRGTRLADLPTDRVDATRMIWTFFAAHPKP